MRRRITRVSVVVAVMGALCVVTPPPAHAVAFGAMAIQGTLSVGAGISYPCWDGTVQPAKCDPTSNTAGVVFGGTLAGVLGNGPTMPGKANTVEAGTSSVSGTGTMTGACGLSQGVLTGSIQPAVSVGTKSKSRGYTLSWISVGGLAVADALTDKGETLTFALFVYPDAAGGSSCVNKAAKNFLVVGTLIVDSPATPVTCSPTSSSEEAPSGESAQPAAPGDVLDTLMAMPFVAAQRHQSLHAAAAPMLPPAVAEWVSILTNLVRNPKPSGRFADGSSAGLTTRRLQVLMAEPEIVAWAAATAALPSGSLADPCADARYEKRTKARAAFLVGATLAWFGAVVITALVPIDPITKVNLILTETEIYRDAVYGAAMSQVTDSLLRN